MNCSNCKATVSAAAKFCTTCGTKVNQQTSTTAAAPKPATQSIKPAPTSSSTGTTYCNVCGEPIIGKSCRTCDAKSSITASIPAPQINNRPPSGSGVSNKTPTPATNQKKCPKCGTLSSLRVCTSCGEKLDQPSSSSTSTSSSSGTRSRPTSTSMPAPVKTTTTAVSSTKTVDNSNSSSSSFKCQHCGTMNATKFCSNCGEKIIDNANSTNSTTSSAPSKPSPSPRNSLSSPAVPIPSPSKTTPTTSSTTSSSISSSPSSSSTERKCQKCSTLNTTKFCTACGSKIDEPSSSTTPAKPAAPQQTPPPPPAKQTVPPPTTRNTAPPAPTQAPPKQTTPPPPPAKQAIPPPPPKNTVPPPPPPKQSGVPARGPIPPPPPKNTVPPPPPAKKAIPPPPSTPKPPPPNIADDPKLKNLLEENERLKQQLEEYRKQQLKDAQNQPPPSLNSSHSSYTDDSTSSESGTPSEPAERSWKKKISQAKGMRESSDSVSSSDSTSGEGPEDPTKHRSWKKKYETLKSTGQIPSSNAGEVSAPVKKFNTVRQHRSFTDTSLPPRERVVREIIDTEEDYVADLETIVNVFLTPLRRDQTASPEDIIGVFSNIEYILAVNKQLCEDLRNSGGKNIGSIFLKKKDYLRVYSTYCSNQQTSLDIFQRLVKKEKKFESFLQYTYARPECQGLDLGSFMIKPIQRICKYPLLMKELLKQTDAAHEEYQQTKDALQAIEDLLSQINEKKRDAESVQKVIELTKVLVGAEGHKLVEPTRRYIREGEMSHYNNKKEKEGYFFLFNDVFVFSKRKGSKFKLLAFILLKTADIRVAVTYERPCFELINTVDNSVWPLIMNSQDQVVSFMSELQALIEKEQNRGSTRQSVKTQKLDDMITFECEYTEKKSVYMTRDKFTYEDLYYAIADQFGVQAITIMYGEYYIYTQQDVDSILAEGKSFYNLLIYDYYDYSNSENQQ